jgi:hypothetical protein
MPRKCILEVGFHKIKLIRSVLSPRDFGGDTVATLPENKKAAPKGGFLKTS